MDKNDNKKGYKKLNIKSEKLKEISVTPNIIEGKMVFNKKNKSHRYIVNE